MKTVCALIFVILLSLSGAAQTAPQIEKVEPPSWWTNHSLNPVRMLIRGGNLRGAAVKSPDKSLTISNLRVNSRGDYLFFDLTIATSAKTGKYNFELQTPGGKTAIPFEILAPLDTKTNFQGITNEDVIYLIMPDRFADGDESNNARVNRENPRMWHGGDLRGVIKNLPYFKELGVTAIWLTPWYENSDEITECDKPWCPMASYHGYGATDYYQVENHFGTMQDLQELVREAHKNDLKIIQDQVANHVGSRHVWAKNPPLENWFSKFEQNTFNDSVLFSPNAAPAEYQNLIRGWFDPVLPDLNQDEPEVARYEIQNALWWIGITGADGIRQDTIQYMPRTFIRDWSTAIKKQYPKFWMVGEVFEEDSAHTAFFQGGNKGWDDVDTALPSVFDFNLWETSNEVFTGKKPAKALRDVLKYDGLYPNVNNLTTFSSNHDTNRFMSLDGATVEGAKLHLAFLLTTRGIPQIYYGEEFAWRGGHEPANRQDFPGGWKTDERDAFKSNERTAEEERMSQFVRKWIAIRRASDALKFGKTIDLRYDADVYLFARQHQNKIVVVGINRGDKEMTIEFPLSALGLTAGNYVFSPNGAELPGNIAIQTSQNGIAKLVLPAKNVVAYKVDKALN